MWNPFQSCQLQTYFKSFQRYLTKERLIQSLKSLFPGGTTKYQFFFETKMLTVTTSVGEPHYTGCVWVIVVLFECLLTKKTSISKCVFTLLCFQDYLHFTRWHACHVYILHVYILDILWYLLLLFNTHAKFISETVCLNCAWWLHQQLLACFLLMTHSWDYNDSALNWWKCRQVH